MNLDKLKAVHAEVNRLPYRTDAERYGQFEFWAEIDSHGGDCEDFALAKYRRLREAGWPQQNLNFATCWLPSGEYHAVLVATLDGQHWVLCNTKSQPVRWQDYDCRWWSKTTDGTLTKWYRINVTR